MMINKRLISLVPECKKYIALNVLIKWISLLSNIVLVSCAVHILCSADSNTYTYSIIILLSLAVSFLCPVLSGITGYRAGADVKKTLRSLIYKKLLSTGSGYQDKTQTAKAVQLSVEGVEQLESWFALYLPQLFYSMAASVTLFTVISFMSFKMALVLLLCVPLIPVSIVIVQKTAKRLLSKYWGEYSNLADSFLENLQGLTALKVYNADGFKHKQMNEEAEHFRRVTMKVLLMQLNSIIVMDIIAWGGAALGIIFALKGFYEHSLSLEKCIICILLSADFFIPLRRLGSFFHTAMNGQAAADKIFDLLDYEEAGPEVLCNSLDIKSSIDEDLISINKASCSFNEKAVLKNISLKVKKGSLVLFTGKSGSGKSTLAKIICGFNKNYEGSVRIGGAEVNTIIQRDLYKNIVYISHLDWIFKGSVRDTLLEGKCNAHDEEMWNCLEKVRLRDFVKERGGLDMQINENALNLSGGQKQRLSIARALMHDSEIMIFDEATSNIDVESEKVILELFQKLKGKKTIIIISHHNENPLEWDCVYNFKNGEVS